MSASHGAASFIERLDPEVARSIRVLGRPFEFRVGELVSRQGDAGDSLLLVAAGVVKITALSPSGTEVILGFRVEGDLLGESSALTGGTRSGNVIGHEAGILLRIPAGRFRTLAMEQPQILMAMLGVSGERLRQSDLDRVLFASYDVPHRVAATLLDWARLYGEGSSKSITIRLRVSRKELAQAVAASEKSVDSVLTTLRGLHLVETGRRRFMVPDPLKLRAWMEERGRA